jgi:hypothetical protein
VAVIEGVLHDVSQHVLADYQQRTSRTTQSLILRGYSGLAPC